MKKHLFYRLLFSVCLISLSSFSFANDIENEERERPVWNPFYPQKIDSIITFNDDERVLVANYFYDDRGYVIREERIQQITSDYYDKGDALKMEYDYDSHGNQTLEVSYYLDAAVTEWTGGNKKEETYDTNNNRIRQIGSGWDSSKRDWVPNGKIEDTYNNEGESILKVFYDWNAEINDWVFSAKYKSAYDTNNNRTLEAFYDWDEGQNRWIGDNKEEYSFNENNQVLTTTYYYWDYDENEWQISKKEENAYNAEGKQLHRSECRWYYGNDYSCEERKYEYRYDENTNTETMFESRKDDYSDGWTYYQKIECVYDNQKYPITETLYYWNPDINDWGSFYSQYEYVYRDNGQVSFLSMIFNFDDRKERRTTQSDLKGEPELKSQYNWDSANNDWKWIGKNEYIEDDNGNELLYTDYEWDDNTNDWRLISKDEAEYNEYGNPVRAITINYDKETDSYHTIERVAYYQ